MTVHLENEEQTDAVMVRQSQIALLVCSLLLGDVLKLAWVKLRSGCKYSTAVFSVASDLML